MRHGGAQPQAHLEARKHGLQLAERFLAAREGEVVGELVNLCAIRAGSERAANRIARTRQASGEQRRTAATLCFSSGPMVSSSTWRVRVSARSSGGALARLVALLGSRGCVQRYGEPGAPTGTSHAADRRGARTRPPLSSQGGCGAWRTRPRRTRAAQAPSQRWGPPWEPQAHPTRRLRTVWRALESRRARVLTQRALSGGRARQIGNRE